MGQRINLRPLHEQVIVITGASSGIGLATARMAARKGAKLVLAARNQSALSDISAELADKGCEVLAVDTDVKLRDDVARLAEAALSRFGRIDTWVNNAGLGMFASLREIDLDDHREVFEVLYWGVVHGSLQAVEHLRHQGGALITVGSVLSDVPIPLQGPYVAAKHAVRGFTDTLRLELAHEQLPISVTLIKPSAIATPFSDHATTMTEEEPIVPPPRYAPELVADAILHCATHEKRELYVGGVAPGMAMLHSVAPALYDKVAMGMGYKAQLSDRPVDPSDPMRGNLYGPRQDGMVTSPSLDSPGIPFSLYTEIAKRPQIALGAAAAVLAGAALVAAGRSRSNGANHRNGHAEQRNGHAETGTAHASRSDWSNWAATLTEIARGARATPW